MMTRTRVIAAAAVSPAVWRTVYDWVHFATSSRRELRISCSNCVVAVVRRMERCQDLAQRQMYYSADMFRWLTRDCVRDVGFAFGRPRASGWLWRRVLRLTLTTRTSLAPKVPNLLILFCSCCLLGCCSAVAKRPRTARPKRPNLPTKNMGKGESHG